MWKTVLGAGTVLMLATIGARAEWQVVCNDDVYCYAARASDDGAFTLKVERSATPDIALLVTVKPEDALDVDMAVEIAVPGTGFAFEGAVTKVYSGNEAAFSAKAGEAFLDALRRGRLAQVLIRHGGSVGTRVHDVSLDGLSIALADIDTRQGRAGRVDAAVLWGGIPSAETVETETFVAEDEPIDPTPVEMASNDGDGPSGEFYGQTLYEAGDLPDRVLKFGYDVYGCDFETTLQGYGAQAYGAGGNGDFYFVPCFSGDVNIEHYAAHVSEQGTELLEFELPIGQNLPNRTTIINPSFDGDALTVTATTYDSPNYDCGVWEKHQWVADQRFFELVEYRVKSACDGVMTPPETYPLDWTIDEMGG